MTKICSSISDKQKFEQSKERGTEIKMWFTNASYKNKHKFNEIYTTY